jgi:hypothetical protein
MDKTKSKLAFWQSKAFFTLTRDKNGRVHEQEVGSSKPKGIELVKGGRNKAYEEAERRWHKATEAEDSEAGEAEPSEELGISPPEGSTIVSHRPLRITPPFPRLGGGG